MLSTGKLFVHESISFTSTWANVCILSRSLENNLRLRLPTHDAAVVSVKFQDDVAVSDGKNKSFD